MSTPPTAVRPFNNFGRNQAFEFQALANKDPKKASETAVRYTPKEAPKFNDAFGYAEQDIKMFDKNKDGLLDLEEVRALFKGNKDIADTFFKTLDTNGDNKIDAVEMTAYLLFADDSTNQVKQTITAMSDGGLLTKKQTADANASLAPIIRGADSAADGEITPKERAVADFAILSMPNISKEILKAIPEALDLRKKYADFKAKDPDRVPPPAK